MSAPGLFEDGSTDPLWEQEPLLAQISAASVQGMVATGDRAGRRVRRRLSDPEDGFRAGALCYASRGFSLHAATRVEATDRRRLEQLCRYVVRPPVASGRLRFVHAQTLEFTLKTPWADGT
ncbi:MAG: transposase, partial [Acidobacteria bacterium]|nr:transposase [Acidobacteriota bacterium]